MPETDDGIEVLLFESSPYGNLTALVQCDGRTIYFYLQGDEAFGARACWVRNLEVGPWVFSEDDLRAGRPPLLPRVHLVPQADMVKPDPTALRILWFAEGNGAYLMLEQDVLAVIPPWSGQAGFHGYARDCASENLVCSPLPPADALRQSVHRDERFWESWKSGLVFQQAQPQILKTYATVFGELVQYYAIEGGRFPPRGVACFRNPRGWVAATVGMSLCPQPNAPAKEQHDPLAPSWIEIAWRFAGDASADELTPFVQVLSGVSQLPWTRFTWLGPGQTVQVAGSDSPHKQFRILAHGLQPEAGQLTLPAFFEQPVELLWLVELASDSSLAV